MSLGPSLGLSTVAGLAIVVALFTAALAAPWLAPHPFDRADFAGAWQFPSSQHWMGTDGIGRDLLARVLHGARPSLGIALASQVLSLAIGLPLGLVAGWYGGRADYFIMRLVDVSSSFPSLFFAVLIMASLGSGSSNVVLAIGLTGWIRFCRLARAQLLQLREEEYVTAARVLGAGPLRIMCRHLLPNASSPLVVAIGLAIPFAIFTEAGLSFLGLGVSPPAPSWGQMAGESIAHVPYYWHLALFPSLAVALAMLGFTLTAGGLADSLSTANGAPHP